MIVGCLLLASVEAEVKYGDQVYLEQQKDLLLTLKYVHQQHWNSDLYAFGFYYKISEDYENYNDLESVKKFVRFFELDRLLSKQAAFSLYETVHFNEASALFKVFLAAKDYETLARVVAWARFNVNEKLFMYVLGVTVAHREDLKTLIMPPPYEVCPYQFVHSEAIKFAQHKAMQGFYGVEKVNGYKEIVVPVNYTGWFMHMNEDQKVSYFTEDVSWNAFYYNYNLDYPDWLDGEQFGLNKDRRGELYITVHQQMLARYYLERLSNGLGHIPGFNWYQPIKSGYNPLLFTVNGKQFSSRPNNYNYARNSKLSKVKSAEQRDSRLRDAVDAGFFTYDDKIFNLSRPEDVNTLGNLIQGNSDNNEHNYRYFEHFVPKFLENFSTAARDPFFYQFYKNLLQTYWKFMSHIKPYTVEEVGFSGVKIIDAEVGKLETFFEYYDIDITNAIDKPEDKTVKKPKDVTEVNFKPDEYFIKARTIRLNHKPFEYKIIVQSEAAQEASVRVFIGPKFDEYDNVISFSENRKNFVLLDVFKKSLTAGKNVITRNSASDIILYGNDFTSYFELYKRVLSGKSGKREWTEDLLQGRCQSPKHLMLPKGKKGGMTYQFYFVVTPYQSAATPLFSNFNPKTSCGIGSGARFFEDRSLLFPLDREIDEVTFFTPNMHFEDVEIFFNAEQNAIRYF